MEERVRIDMGLFISHGTVTYEYRILSITDSLGIDELHLISKFLLTGIRFE